MDPIIEPNKSSSPKRRAFLFLLFVAPGIVCLAFYYFVIREPLSKGKQIFKKLPHYGPSFLSENGSDSVFHKVPSFRFTGANGEEISSATLKDKMYVASFFFTTCQTICPKMSTQIYRIQDKLHYLRREFKIISHSVNPSFDTPEVLKRYAAEVHADPELWLFATGREEQTKSVMKNGYLLPAADKDGAEIFHSEQVVLIDKQGCIRGYYDGTSMKDMDRLVDEVVVLAAEYGKLKNNSNE